MSTMTVLGVPTSAGSFAPGQEHAPAALREAGLVGALEERGIDVRDLGDRELWRWRPDPERPRAQNLPQVVEIVRDTAARVESALGDGPLLVLGGDCSIELGVLSGHLGRDESVGLVYLDLHPDLNTPKSIVEGTFDWMGMAHALGLEDAAPELVGVGPRTPLLHDDQVFFLGYGPARAQPFELDQMVRRHLAAIAVDDVAKDPEGSAGRALAALDRFDHLLVHFDVDVVDFNDAQLSEDAVRGDGLTLDAAMRALSVLAGSDRLGAVTVTEINPLHGDEEGETLRTFVGRLAAALGGG